MKKILICINSVQSHFYSTIDLAEVLRKQGIQIHYIGFSKIRDIVISHGFIYHELKSFTNKDFSLYKNKISPFKLSENYKNIHDEMELYIKEINPNLIFVPTLRLSVFYLPVYNSKIPFLLYTNTYAGVQASSVIPPCRYSYIPKNFEKFNMKVILLWFKRFIKYDMRVGFFLSQLLYPNLQERQIAASKKIKRYYSMNGFFYDYKRIILGPSKLDFKKQDGWVYSGINTYERYKYIKSNDKVTDFIKTDNRPIIYCCFGTSCFKFKKMNLFLEKIIGLLKKRQDWRLIISLGGYDCKEFKIDGLSVPSNVLIENFVDQLKVLSYSNIAIFHGGFGTLKECVKTNTPMLIFPCSYDEFGNASRVEYHGIGIVDKTMELSFLERKIKSYTCDIDVNKIEMEIEELLKNESYLIKIKKIMNDIIIDNESEHVVNYIKNFLN